jgi:Protein of unknown function (DUF2934)
MHGNGQFTGQARKRHRSSDPREQRLVIAAQAHELWKAAGRPEGRDLEFWSQAEAQLEAARHNHRRKAGASPARQGIETPHTRGGHARSRRAHTAFREPG